MRHLISIVIIAMLFAITSCLGHRNSGSKSAPVVANPDPGINTPRPGPNPTSPNPTYPGPGPQPSATVVNTPNMTPGVTIPSNPSKKTPKTASPSPSPCTNCGIPGATPTKTVTSTVTKTVTTTKTPTKTPTYTASVTASASPIITKTATKTPTKVPTKSPTPVVTASATQVATQTPTDPLSHPRGIVLVPSLSDTVSNLYACGEYMYAVTRYTGKIKSDSSVQQVLHKLKVAKHYEGGFNPVSIKKSGSSEAPYLLEGLTCVNNQWLSGTYRYMQGNVWYEYVFIYNPVDKSMPLNKKIHTSATTTDNTAWRTSDIRNDNQATSGVAVDVVKPDLIKVTKAGDNIVLTVFKEKYKFDRYILTGGTLNSITQVQNNSLVASYNSSGAYYGASVAQGPSTAELLTVKLEKGSTAPNVYKWTYNSASGKKITLNNAYAISGDKNIDVNVIQVADKDYLIYRNTSDGKIKKGYDLSAGLSGTTFDGTNSAVTFPAAQGKAFIEQAVYAGDGIYAFINSSNYLVAFKRSGTTLSANTYSDTNFNLPNRYTYLLKYKELKTITNKYAKNAALVAGGIGDDEVYLNFTYGDKNLTYKGRLSEFAEWARQ